MSLPEICGNAVSRKFWDFLFALERLCKEHDVTLSVSGYDGLQVWDANEGGDVIHCNGIVDYTHKGE